jgi:flavin reductase (DIM6/NTAB) family NADH-FMN oxidoreductase RutF
MPPLCESPQAISIWLRRFAFRAPSMVSSKTCQMPTPPLSQSEFRKALGHFSTGVTVVTVEREPGKIHGMTANSFTSVSLEPMLILVCVDHRAKMLHLLEKKKREHSSEVEQRLGIHFRPTPGGAPVIEGTLLQMGCNLIASHLAGDHTIFVGEVHDAEVHEGEPLLYFRGEYRRIARHS